MTTRQRSATSGRGERLRAGDLACVPHNYMIGAFVYGDLAGTHAASMLADSQAPQQFPADQIAAAHELIYRPLRYLDGPPQPQVEYKLRRFVNDYVAPPKTAAKLSIAVQTFERMRTEIAGIGATTPHELLRAVEVSFIRDCAEMAARSSFTRTESRWGLYHDRSDTPERDDVDWRYHLNLRKDSDGDMEFLKRPVAPYFVPVPGLDELPSGETEPIPVRQPDLVGGQAPASEVLRADPGVRRTAVDVLPDPGAVRSLLASDDASVRGAAVYVLSARRVGTAVLYHRALTDLDHRVRIEAVCALVSVDDAGGVADARADANREVCITVANGLGTLRTGTETIRALIDDIDPLVWGAALAALAAMGSIGWVDADATTVEGALEASAWQIRQGAVRALAGASSSTTAVPPLSRALSDPHLDVRKAAVLSLTRWVASGTGAREALTGALDDGDSRCAGLRATGAGGCGITHVRRMLMESLNEGRCR